MKRLLKSQFSSLAISSFAKSLFTRAALLVILLASAGHCPADCVPPPSGLVSWWPGEGDATDIAGTNPGILFNGITFATGQVGQAFSFDGSSSYVQVPASATLDVGQNDGFTMEAWINPPD